MQPVRVLSIAGSDSGGGAGIQADIKTITMMGGHAMTAITALTAQNSQGVAAVTSTDPDMVAAQIDAVVNDFGVDAIKIGMLGSAAIAEVVADRLEKLPKVPVVFDPVMVATSGGALADDATIAAFGQLMALASLTTPNLPELDALGGEAELVKRDLTLLIKGGHDGAEEVTDRLVNREGEIARWSDPRIDTLHSHGTGCTLSSAIAVGLGQGLDLQAAITQARDFVRLALRSAPDLVPSNGPMGHPMMRNDAVMPGPLFNQVTLDCTDFDASIAFYTRLGLTLIVYDPDEAPLYARFEASNGATLSLHEADSVTSSASIYFEFPDVDKAVDKLRNNGWIFDGSPEDKSWNWCEAWTTDPSGHRICIYHAGEDRRYPPWRI
ncbi:bifunctional hydroxymethylpyrimidine kinase/phosphomethylpyrimidine kinase [Alterisphingorhabdus coralli]|uniref:hydroxymethylpyrimidine kinase n=1 Tax=Alterisphingorhabdus coralli TaxID=3071408 RepID=A0AA97FBD1_9SPHN|nr:bifunctional hydroxymethylpyrimidine kinase/phosphomethylpyrimidine kinase [Parasphingorhabdus sp. SCSIO 66989]WOE76527.1 bifunctional hydroxymethylpyrimidine kinase/phosphomethylpyrimidine kinase [Parasphingorhabdus sp. SCSIO 66989]